MRPECDFCPRKLPGFGDKRVFVDVGGAVVRASLYVRVEVGTSGGGDEDNLIRWSWRADDTGGLIGDLARAVLSREGGRAGGGALAGALLLRVAGCCVCFALTSLLGLKSSSSSMTSPISKSSSGSGYAGFTLWSAIWVFFFISSNLLRCFPLCPDSNKPSGMTRPSSSLSFSSQSLSSVPGKEIEDAEFEEQASAKPRVE